MTQAETIKLQAEQIENLQERVRELEASTDTACWTLTDIERDLDALSGDVIDLQESQPDYASADEIADDAAQRALARLFDYASLRLAANGTATELLDLLREGVRYGA